MTIEAAVLFGRGLAPARGRDNSCEEDATLVAKVKSGDAAAFNALVKKYRTRLFSVIYNMTDNRDDAFDLAQDVFIKAYKGIKDFSGRSAFFTWLYRIAVNTSITKIKKDRLRKFFSLESEGEVVAKNTDLECFVSKEDSKKNIFLTELHENLNAALQKLSNKHRAVVVLCEIEGLDSAEAAAVLKCSEGTVRSRLHYAKEQLKISLKKYL